jgi:hypothetical protein
VTVVVLRGTHTQSSCGVAEHPPVQLRSRSANCPGGEVFITSIFRSLSIGGNQNELVIFRDKSPVITQGNLPSRGVSKCSLGSGAIVGPANRQKPRGGGLNYFAVKRTSQSLVTGVLLKSSSRMRVGRAAPSAPWEVAQTRTFCTSTVAGGALGTARLTPKVGQHALTSAATAKGG